MFRRPSKKQRLIRRVIVSAVMVVAVIVIVVTTVLYMLGYRLDSDNGRLEQGALVQFDTRPTGANVSIDGKGIGSRTSTKQSVVAGEHDFLMSRAGYHDWRKTLTVQAGTLTWLDYVRLIPTTLTPQSVASFSSVVAVKAAPDNESMLVQTKTDMPVFSLIDIRDTTIKQADITLPASVYTVPAEGQTQTFALGSYDTGGRYMTMTHTLGDTKEWIVLDTENPDRSVNVTRLLSANFKDIQFAGTNGSTLFGLGDDNVVRKLDLSGATLSRGLISNVSEFSMYENNLLSYVGTDGSDKVAGVYRDGDEAPHVLRRTTNGTPLKIDISRYYSDDYVAIAENDIVTVLKGRYPVSSQEDSASLKNFAEIRTTTPVDLLSFSSEGDYLVMQSGNQSISYEVEYYRETRSQIASGSTPRLQWLDRAYVWSVIDGKATIREFDGNNSHMLLAANDGFDTTLSRNGRFFYAVSGSGENFQLHRVELQLQ